MLGHVVTRYFREAGCEVITLRQRYFKPGEEEFMRAVADAQAEWYINAAGMRARAGSDPSALDEVNCGLPRACLAALPPGAQMVHASSDGVFRPDLPARKIDETPDATDDYGRSKIAAEEALRDRRAHVIRCSIIGPELAEPRSLLEWFLRRAGPVASGYRNQMWNGITTLEWAKTCRGIMESEDPRPHLMQPGFLPPVSKAGVLRAIAAGWRKNIDVQDTESPSPVKRFLIPTKLCAGLEEQLRELHQWYYA